jgi:hypothetical protein
VRFFIPEDAYKLFGADPTIEKFRKFDPAGGATARLARTDRRNRSLRHRRASRCDRDTPV